MIRAVVKNGQIQPLEPLPSNWTDGRELFVEAEETPEKSSVDIDRWFAELEASVAKNDPEDLDRMEATLREADIQAKAVVRREMGLE